MQPNSGKIGRYSGQARLDPARLEEPDADDPEVRAIWFDDERHEPSFKRHVTSKIAYHENIIGKKMADLDITVIGHSHIDVCWLWRYEQTRKKARVTFDKACEMAEKWYPGGYTFHQSQPQLFEWVAQDYPALLARIKEQVKQGSFNIVGGSWVEPDCMMPSGEAFIRQRLNGMWFFHDTFGVMPEIEWMMDSFGYGRNLPQILVKSGAKYFWTTKITWNRCTIFPFVNFWWQSPDGSRIVCHESQHGFGTLEKWNMFELGRHPLQEGGKQVWDYTDDYDDLCDHVTDDINPHVGLWYGKGDGGHGPTSQEVAEMMEFQAQGAVKIGRAKDFFEKLAGDSARFPVWNDELYLEYHRGTFTTHARVKRNNRRLECKAIAVEMLCALARATVAGYAYPAADITTTWKTILKNQFHDALPGSSIPEAYDDLIEDWDACDGLLDGCVAGVANSYKVPAGHVAVFNPNGAGPARIFIPASAVPGVALDRDGLPPRGLARAAGATAALQPVPAEHPAWLEARPAGWWTVLPLDGVALNEIAVAFDTPEVAALFEKEIAVDAGKAPCIENDILRVELDPATGAIVKATSSLIPHVDNIFKGPSNVPMAFLDNFPNDQAWNILNTRTPEYDQHRYPHAQDEDVAITITARGPVLAELTIARQFGLQPVVQKVALFKGIPEICCEFLTDWKEPTTLVKIAFDTATDAPLVESDNQYCTIQRKTTPETPADKARWEKIQHKFSDMHSTDGSWGIAFLNNGKYAFDTLQHDVFRLTVLKSANYPKAATESWAHAERAMNWAAYGKKQPQYTDLGPHRTFYAIYPHAGITTIDAGGKPTTGVKQRADAFNFPLLVLPPVQAGKAHVPAGPLVSSSNPAIMVKSVKQALKDRGVLVVRLVEYTGHAGETRIDLHPALAAKVSAVREGDLLERAIGEPLDLASPIAAGKWEIKTLLLSLA